MEQIKVKFKKLYPGAEVPKYMSSGASGMDVKAYFTDEFSRNLSGTDDKVYLDSGVWAAIPTGLSVEIPPGYEIQVRPRSGLAFKSGITVLNTPGTIDSDYRGEIKVILINHGHTSFEIKNGDRIAQLIVAPVVQANIEEVVEISETERGSGGLGSTGV